MKEVSMSARVTRGLALAGALVAFAAAAAPAGKAEVVLPAGYRGWKHVRSIAVGDPDHAMYGFHDGYANEAALRGLRARPVRFQDGATFVVSIYDLARKEGVTTAGAKRRTVVQVKDRSAAATGGWRFAAFDPSGKPVKIDEASCFGCHGAAKETDSVFTAFRE
jgi:hypothetical protein